MQSSEQIGLLSILLPHRHRAVLYLYFESYCQWCAETCWNLTRMPPLSSIFSVSVWCSTEVTASVDTVPTIMLDKEHAEQIPPSSCTEARQVCRAPISLGVHEGKAIHGAVPERIYLRNTTSYFFFFCAGRGDSLRSHSSEPLWWSGR